MLSVSWARHTQREKQGRYNDNEGNFVLMWCIHLVSNAGALRDVLSAQQAVHSFKDQAIARAQHLWRSAAAANPREFRNISYQSYLFMPQGKIGLNRVSLMNTCVQPRKGLCNNMDLNKQQHARATLISRTSTLGSWSCGISCKS